MMEHIVAFLVLTVAVGFNWKHYRIPNTLVLIGFGAGLILSVIREGSMGLLHGLLRAAIPVFALYLLFFVRTLGAGDIKLFAVTATMCSTTEEVWKIILLSFVIGAVIGLIRLLLNGQLFVRISNFVTYFLQCVQSQSVEPYQTIAPKEAYLHFSVCILLAYAAVTLWEVRV